MFNIYSYVHKLCVCMYVCPSHHDSLYPLFLLEKTQVWLAKNPFQLIDPQFLGASNSISASWSLIFIHFQLMRISYISPWIPLDPHRFGTSTWSSLIAAVADATLDVHWDSVTITADSPRGRMIAATLHGGTKMNQVNVLRCVEKGGLKFGATIRMRDFHCFWPKGS